MEKFRFYTHYRKILADTDTPVSIYLRIRDRFSHAVLLESSDYHGNENTFSYICFEPVSSFRVEDHQITHTYPDGTTHLTPLEKGQQLMPILQEYVGKFHMDVLDLKFTYNGFFGYQSYDAVRWMEEIDIATYTDDSRQIPDVLYYLYRYMIVINHFNNELYLFDHSLHKEEHQLPYLEAILSNPTIPKYGFYLEGEEQFNISDETYLEMVHKGIDHCQQGDVFQIVLSRQFSQEFRGDEFNVYRQLRSINPSPYLFYCDYGSFKLMGSSPEAQLVIEDRRAIIHPIAGTFKRTGNDEEDSRLARVLFDDPKENSEHVMLVDLARNDLSRHGTNVEVDTFKEIQFYSHVIHLVSTVSAEINEEINSLQLAADTFPAGTLSGAPKHKAMQLINLYEPQNRGFYGGCIGYLGLDGNFNHAIMIRSLLSRMNRLYYQAGAGIVSRSVPEKELQEVNNKVGALRKALKLAANTIWSSSTATLNSKLL